MGQTYHLANAGIASWFDVAQAVQDELARLGVKCATVKPISTSQWLSAAARPAYSALDCGKFTRDFGQSRPHWRVSLGPPRCAPRDLNARC